MSVNIFDVTTARVASFVGHLNSISASTSPTAAETEEYIEEAAAKIAPVLRAQGIDPASLTSVSAGWQYELYVNCRQAVTHWAAAMWHMINKRGDTDVSTGLRIQFDNFVAGLKEDKAASTGTSEGVNFRHGVKRRPRSRRYRNLYR